MKSSMRIAFECPWCHKMCGYAMDRGGPVFDNEVVGRSKGSSLECVHCKQPIEVMINFSFKKKGDT